MDAMTYKFIQNLCLYCQVERSFLEWEQRPITVSGTFWEYPQLQLKVKQKLELPKANVCQKYCTVFFNVTEF